MAHIVRWLALAGLAFALSAPARAQSVVLDEATGGSPLFALGTAAGSVEEGVVTLAAVPTVVVVADGPARRVGHMTVAAFLTAWDAHPATFSADPPNAVLSILAEDGGARDVALELTSAKTADEGLAFTFRPLLEQEPDGPFGAATLFIHPECASPAPEDCFRF